MMKRSMAILGAGPIGLEAAIYARALGYDPVVYERGDAGEHVRRWGFIRLFSPWKLETSPLGLEEVRRSGGTEPDPESCPTGLELIESYLAPLARSLGDRLRTGVEVAAISKVGLLKGENIGGRLRARAPFRLLLRKNGEEEEALADIVIDATGVYGNPSYLGDGGIPALGEIAARDAIRYHLADVNGEERAEFAGKSVLVVGAGHGAATSLLDLAALAADAPGTEVIWARRSTGPDPLPVLAADPLPERSRLGREANRIAAEPPPGVTVLSGVAVQSIARREGRLAVTFRPIDGGALPYTAAVDRIIANVGYRPSMAMLRELQVHYCYASEGPMSLAAALLGQGRGGDCLLQSSHGAETLKNPEPGFFIAGAKSYGRRNDFLLRVGREQVRDIFRLIEDDPDLDLHGGAA
jgi:hypothetical protein